MPSAATAGFVDAGGEQRPTVLSSREEAREGLSGRSSLKNRRSLRGKEDCRKASRCEPRRRISELGSEVQRGGWRVSQVSWRCRSRVEFPSAADVSSPDVAISRSVIVRGGRGAPDVRERRLLLAPHLMRRLGLAAFNPLQIVRRPPTHASLALEVRLTWCER